MKAYPWQNTQKMMCRAVVQQAPRCVWGGIARRRSLMERLVLRPYIRALKMVLGPIFGEEAR